MTSADPCASPASATSAPVTMTVNKIEGIQYPFVMAIPNVPLTLQARILGNNYSYEWLPPDGLNFSTIKDPVYKYNKTTEYKIKITSEIGCVTIDTLLVKIDVLTGIRPDVIVPKAWSPNGDRHNDYLFPLNINIKELKYFRIFNRWGQLMFQTSEMLKGWNGIFNGQPQPMDVYNWDVEAIGINGEKIKRTGNAVLLR
jgi:gliding motility-associated-like protein